MKNFEGVTRRACDTSTFLSMKEQAIKAIDLQKENDFMREQLALAANFLKSAHSVNPDLRQEIADGLESLSTIKAD